MENILVVIDLTATSKNAMLYAIELAKLSGSKIILYNCSSKSSSDSNINALEYSEESIFKLINRIEVDYLKALNEVNGELLETNDSLIKEILLIEKNENIDLVVIGTDDNELMTGCISKNLIPDLIKVTTVPLLIIPKNTNFKKIENIAFSVDYILETEIIMHAAVKKFLLCIKPKIFVLNVVKEHAEIMADREKSESNIEKYFENEDHIYSFIENNNLVNGLKDFISCNNIDMITMLPHKHNFLQELFIESNTNKMALNTNIPLMMFPIDR